MISLPCYILRQSFILRSNSIPDEAPVSDDTNTPETTTGQTYFYPNSGHLLIRLRQRSFSLWSGIGDPAKPLRRGPPIREYPTTGWVLVVDSLTPAGSLGTGKTFDALNSHGFLNIAYHSHPHRSSALTSEVRLSISD
ncbi:hypothetical protein L2E82_14866 [Cichorium intybus]|uniref:Uncharacterized protein n=1 Tax=Cichorium intybus TaxID=13427 RepID=A0ACB9F0U8_CICIN|nr:hypothetical protein L2E82_14866 [Cichorium intybus]